MRDDRIRLPGHGHDLIPERAAISRGQPGHGHPVERPRPPVQEQSPRPCQSVGGRGEPQRGIDALGGRAWSACSRNSVSARSPPTCRSARPAGRAMSTSGRAAPAGSSPMAHHGQRDEVREPDGADPAQQRMSRQAQSSHEVWAEQDPQLGLLVGIVAGRLDGVQGTGRTVARQSSADIGASGRAGHEVPRLRVHATGRQARQDPRFPGDPGDAAAGQDECAGRAGDISRRSSAGSTPSRSSWAGPRSR